MGGQTTSVDQPNHNVPERIDQETQETQTRLLSIEEIAQEIDTIDKIKASLEES